MMASRIPYKIFVRKYIDMAHDLFQLRDFILAVTNLQVLLLANCCRPCRATKINLNFNTFVLLFVY
jgi:hypothetical protein